MNEKNYPLNFEHKPTSNLYQNLVQQYFNMIGVMAYFIPMDDYHKEDLNNIFGELTKRNYSHVYGMKIYLEDMMLLNGQDLFSKFGYQVNDEITIYVTRFEFLSRTTGIPENAIVDITSGIDSPYDNTYRDKARDPQIGDLWWTPMWNSMWEITYAEHQDAMVLGYRTNWKIICKKYIVDQNETIDVSKSGNDTGTQEIIDIINSVDDEAKTGIQNIELDPDATGFDPEETIDVLNDDVEEINKDRTGEDKSDIFGNF